MGEMTVERAREVIAEVLRQLEGQRRSKCLTARGELQIHALETLLSATEPKKPQEPFGWLTQQNPNAWGGPEQPWVFRKTMPSDAKGLCGLKPVFDDPVTEPRTVEQVAGLLPEGFCVVPREPTEVILDAGLMANDFEYWNGYATWAAMLAAGAVRGEGK